MRLEKDKELAPRALGAALLALCTRLPIRVFSETRLPLLAVLGNSEVEEAQVLNNKSRELAPGSVRLCSSSDLS
jgi:hypothetical protein